MPRSTRWARGFPNSRPTCTCRPRGGAPNEEERLIDDEAAALRELARERATRSLSVPQRRWLAALTLSANAGAFFEASGKPNLSAASRVLGKDRSSAVRAFGELQHHFGRELGKLR